MSMELYPVVAFHYQGETLTDLGPQWDKWKRSFEYYIVGKGITDSQRKQALLLHCAGSQVQDIFATLPDTGNDQDYQAVLQALDGHFKPLINKFYEHYKFRQLHRQSTESIDRYLARLREQACKCQFADLDQNLLSQTIEKCNNVKVLTKLLEEGNELTLAKVISIARTVETVAIQEQDITGLSTTPSQPPKLREEAEVSHPATEKNTVERLSNATKNRTVMLQMR